MEPSVKKSTVGDRRGPPNSREMESQTPKSDGFLGPQKPCYFTYFTKENTHFGPSNLKFFSAEPFNCCALAAVAARALGRRELTFFARIFGSGLFWAVKFPAADRRGLSDEKCHPKTTTSSVEPAGAVGDVRSRIYFHEFPEIFGKPLFPKTGFRGG